MDYKELVSDYFGQGVEEAVDFAMEQSEKSTFQAVSAQGRVKAAVPK